jgi:hypothetical protein
MTFSSFLTLWAGCVLFTVMVLILYFFIIDVTNDKKD